VRNKIYKKTVLALSAMAFCVLTAPAALAGNSAGDVNASTEYRKIKPPEAWGTTIMERNTRGTETKGVLFPHWAHRNRYTCSVCHTDLGFAMKAGGTNIKQSDIEEGKYCGACHDSTTAFGSMDCDKCHTRGLDVPKNGNSSAVFDKLPTDHFGNKVDWVKALRAGAITPAASLDGQKKMTVLDLDITIPSKKFTPHPPNVVFPHKAHTEVMECTSCHPSIFEQKKGGNPDMNMMKIISGKYCGQCHTTVAFPLEDCFRCHSGPVPEAVEIDRSRQEKRLKETLEKDKKKSYDLNETDKKDTEDKDTEKK